MGLFMMKALAGENFRMKALSGGIFKDESISQWNY
jgi:hypothetical protein